MCFRTEAARTTVLYNNKKKQYLMRDRIKYKIPNAIINAQLIIIVLQSAQCYFRLTILGIPSQQLVNYKAIAA